MAAKEEAERGGFPPLSLSWWDEASQNSVTLGAQQGPKKSPLIRFACVRVFLLTTKKKKQ